MNLSNVLVPGLLIIGLLAFGLTTVGIFLVRDAYDQLHFLAPASLIGAIAIPGAVLIKEGFSQAGSKAIAISLLLVLANPILSHATARAARVRRRQQWVPTPDDHAVVPEEAE